MILATALAAGNEPSPRLVREAVHRALEKAGLTSARSLLLFLTSEFSRDAQAAVTAATQAAQCTPVFGGIVSGVLTETEWVLDRPAAAVMVFGGNAVLQLPENRTQQPILSYSGDGKFPEIQHNTASHVPNQHFGSVFEGSFAETSFPPTAWQLGRLVSPPHFSAQIDGMNVSIGVSPGLRRIGTGVRIESCAGLEVKKLGEQSALKHLLHSLPSLRDQSDMPPTHRLMALVTHEESGLDAFPDGNYRTLAVVSINADESVTLAGESRPGDFLCWATRDPATAESDMRRTVGQLIRRIPNPEGALMFSCIGRGPFFYGDEDGDLAVLREQLPDLPILGCYGTGQIAPIHNFDPSSSVNGRFLRNAVVTAFLGASRIHPPIRKHKPTGEKLHAV